MAGPAAVDARRGAGSPAERGQVFFSILVEFWLTDADEPMPAAATPAAPAGKAGKADRDVMDRAAMPSR